MRDAPLLKGVCMQPSAVSEHPDLSMKTMSCHLIAQVVTEHRFYLKSTDESKSEVIEVYRDMNKGEFKMKRQRMFSRILEWILLYGFVRTTGHMRTEPTTR